jgi:hypothetical protein
MLLCHSRVTARLQSTEEPPEESTWPPSTSVSPKMAESATACIRLKGHLSNPRPSTGRQGVRAIASHDAVADNFY